MANKHHNDLRIQEECIELMVSHSWTSADVARHRKIKISTLRNWKAFYMLHGYTPAKGRRIRAKLGPRVESRLFTPALQNVLRTIVTEHPYFYLDELQTELYERSGTRASLSTIHKILTGELGWTLQLAESSARERNALDRAEHHAVLNEITDDPAQFVFVDESSKDRDTILRKRLWQPRGHPLSISRYFSDHADHSYTLIGACDINGFITEACELVRRKRNANDNDDEAGTVDMDRFNDYIEYKLLPTLGNYYLGQPRSIVVMDNASIHNHDRVRELIEGVGALLIYQPAYSPDMDPIEFCFHQYKCDLRRHRASFGNDSFGAHFHALGAVLPSNMRAYYKKVGGIRNVPDEVKENENVSVADAVIVTAAAAVSSIVQNNTACALLLLN